MSRQVDTTDLASLSEEDKQYLYDRGNPAITAQLDALAAEQASKAPAKDAQKATTK